MVAGSSAINATNFVVAGTELYAAAETGLYQLHVAGEPRLELLDDSIRHIAVDRKGRLWAVDRDARAGVWRGDMFDALVTIE